MKRKMGRTLAAIVPWLIAAALLPAGPAYCVPSATIGDPKTYGSGNVEKTGFHPGESFQGRFTANISGVEFSWVRVDVTYNVPTLLKTSSDYSYLGNETHTFSSPWWALPINKYSNLQPFNFNYSCTPEGGSTVESSATFRMVRNALVNATGAYQFTSYATPVAINLNKFISAHCARVKSLLAASPLKSAAVYEAKSDTASAFLASLKLYRPNVLLVHANAGQTQMTFPDNTYVSSNELLNYGYCYDDYKVSSGLAFLAHGDTAYGSAQLASAFRSCGYNAVIGFDSSYIYEYHIAAFYEKFFREAIKPGISVATALDNAKTWARAINSSWYDVAGYSSGAKIIGDGTILYLGGGPEPSLSALRRNRKVPAIDAYTEPQDPWREAGDSVLTNAERRAIRIANGVQVPRQLREEYGSALRVGVVHYPRVHRIVYKAGDSNLYGVDVDARTFRVIDQGEIN